ncbi:thioesterase family protein [Rhodoblastus sp.]|uniref:thioesterase family protein n=1 Tax=Rhodoblastus sp. TaxID=1962975 RepID=UPI002630CE7E|nr:thioesterase family protein [Rhodoblastus sp.]
MPKSSLVVGLTHETSLLVTPDLTVPNVSGRLAAFGDMPPVFATAFLVAFFEAACIECLRGHLQEGEHTVGVHVDVSHVAATPVGMNVTVKVKLIEIEGRRLTFRVRAEDGTGLIGEGAHQRAIINIGGFLDRVAAKANSGGSAWPPEQAQAEGPSRSYAAGRSSGLSNHHGRALAFRR